MRYSWATNEYYSISCISSTPGEFILSTAVGGEYTVWSGTSLSAPHVTGVIALMIAAYGHLPVRTLRAMLHSNTLVLDNGYFVQF
ncbi:MAG: S8 family serine peptidase [Candidatus Heimdallarchaeota archaeon]|nr:S8 family serine peptidase [Candidatus Heimdallarchaeota archaeon]